VNTGGNSGDNEHRQMNPSRMWPAIINAINSCAAYYRESAKPRDDPYSSKIARWTKVTGIGTCAAAFLAAITASVFWCQLRTMEVANEDSRNAFIGGNRAWISPYGAEPSGLTGDGFLTFEVMFINGGKSPGTQLNWKIDGDTIQAPQDKNWGGIKFHRNSECDGLQPIPEGGVAYPFVSGMDVPTRGFDSGKKFPLAAQQDGTHMAYFRGCVAYRTMNVIGHSAFCFMFAPIVPDTTGHVSGRAMQCPTGNWAD
jgi:hypothetical protein